MRNLADINQKISTLPFRHGITLKITNLDQQLPGKTTIARQTKIFVGSGFEESQFFRLTATIVILYNQSRTDLAMLKACIDETGKRKVVARVIPEQFARTLIAYGKTSAKIARAKRREKMARQKIGAKIATQKVYTLVDFVKSCRISERIALEILSEKNHYFKHAFENILKPLLFGQSLIYRAIAVIYDKTYVIAEQLAKGFDPALHLLLRLV